jgi:hypothetical protein
MARARAMLNLLVGIARVIDMSDPEHPKFADSSADCLDALLVHEGALRAILAELIPAQASPLAFAPFSQEVRHG